MRVEAIKDKKNIIISFLISVILAIWIQRDIWPNNSGLGYYLLETVFSLCFVLTCVFSAKFIFWHDVTFISTKQMGTYYLKLLLFQTVAFLPMYIQRFMYGDDLWGFSGSFNGDLSSGIYYSRPFLPFLQGALLKTSSETLNYFRILNGFILFLFGCIFFKFLVLLTKKIKTSFTISLMLIAGCFAVDCVAYASIYPINSSLLLSALSFVLYMEAKQWKKGKKFFLFISVLSLFSAFCMYQIGTPIVFVMYIINETYCDKIKGKKRLVNFLKYLIYYGCTAVGYLVFTKILQILTHQGAGQAARSQLISSFPQALDKIIWFFQTVLPQTINKVIALFAGSFFFNENNMFYYCTYKSQIIGTIITILCFTLLGISIAYHAYKQKSMAYLFLAICVIPLSFWPFLILPESYTLTYYCIGILALFVWYIFDGIRVVFLWLRKKSTAGKIITFLPKIVPFILMLLVFQSNYYGSTAWINYSRDSYEYIANILAANLIAQNNIENIAVIGNLNPYVGGRDYVIFCVEDILRELKLEPTDYAITQSENEFYILSFNDDETANMKEILGSANMEKLMQYYVHDEMYSRWVYNGQATGQEDLNFLQNCFEKTGQIVEDSDTTLRINLNGFNFRNKF